MANAIPAAVVPQEKPTEAAVEAPKAPAAAPAPAAQEPDLSRAKNVERRKDGSVKRIDW